MEILSSDSDGWKPRQPKSIRTGLMAGLVKRVTSLGVADSQEAQSAHDLAA